MKGACTWHPGLQLRRQKQNVYGAPAGFCKSEGFVARAPRQGSLTPAGLVLRN